MHYRYTDGTVGNAKSVQIGGYVYPAAYLARRAAETEAEWIERLTAIGVAPVRYEQPAGFDAATQDKGDQAGALDEAGWWAVTWPDVTDKKQVWSRTTTESTYIGAADDVPDGYTTEVPPDDYPLWDVDAGAWTQDVTRAKTDKLAEIDTALTALDAETVRPLRAILAADAAGDARDQDDVDRLAALETQAAALRATRTMVDAMTVLEDILAVAVSA